MSFVPAGVFPYCKGIQVSHGLACARARQQAENILVSVLGGEHLSVACLKAEHLCEPCLLLSVTEDGGISWQLG